MKENIHFVYDEEWENQEKELQQILHETEEPKLHKNVFILESLMRAAAYTFIDKQPKKTPQILGREITKAKYFQKVLNIPSGEEVYPIPVPSTEKVEQPLHEYKKVTKFEKKIVTEKQPEEIESQKKDLIIDKITNKTLASLQVNNEYILTEPKLEREDIRVLNKVKKKKIKNMEKGWKLIQKYGKKYKIQQGHDTSIKYYVVNDVFGLGIIEPLLHDQEINSFYCDGQDIIINRNGKTLKSNIKLNKEDIISFIQTLSKKFDKKLNKKHTVLDMEARGFKFHLNLGDKSENPKFEATRK